MHGADYMPDDVPFFFFRRAVLPLRPLHYISPGET